MHDEYTDQLSDYLDGELSADFLDVEAGPFETRDHGAWPDAEPSRHGARIDEVVRETVLEDEV